MESPAETIRVAVLRPENTITYGLHSFEMMKQFIEGEIVALLDDDAKKLEAAKNKRTNISFADFDVELKGQLPSLETLDEDFEAIAIMGSKHTAYHEDEWIQQLAEYIRQVFSSRKVKIIGICFGHQIIARALGGNIGKNPVGPTADTRTLELSQSWKDLLGLDFDQVSFIYTHGDCVFEVPPGAESLQRSTTGPFHGFFIRDAVSGTPRVLTLQGHPEYLTPAGHVCLKHYAETKTKDEGVMKRLSQSTADDGRKLSSMFYKFLSMSKWNVGTILD